MAKSSLKIIGLVGERLSGKGELADYLVKKKDFIKLTFSQILTDILKRLHLPESRINMVNLVSALRERFGSEILAEVLLNEIKRHRYKRVVIDGIRHPAEVEKLKKTSGFVLVYVTASLKDRYLRALGRGQKAGENKFTYSEFKNESRLPTEIYIGKIGRKARVKIVNDGTLLELYDQVKNKLSKYLK